MKCSFCPEVEIAPPKSHDAGRCPNCSTEYDIDSKSQKLLCYSFAIEYKHCQYYFDFYCGDKSSTEPFEDEDSFRLCTNHGTILSFDYLPDFTPFNALARLPTLLLFS
jgi:hypothetical protein